MKAVPVTVGVEIVVIDKQNNRTSTTTELITTSVDGRDPSEWNNDGTLRRPTLTAPKTAVISAMGVNQTLYGSSIPRLGALS